MRIHAAFQSEWIEPISTSYHGYDIFQLPHPDRVVPLEMLNILEVCAPSTIWICALGPSNPDYWHFMVEAKKLAYSDLQAYNADPLFLRYHWIACCQKSMPLVCVTGLTWIWLQNLPSRAGSMAVPFI